MLQSKCLSALLGHTLSGNNQFKYFFTWIVLFMWLTLTLFWSVHHSVPFLLSFDQLCETSRGLHSIHLFPRALISHARSSMPHPLCVPL